MNSRSEPPASIQFGRFRVLPHRREVLADGRRMELGGRAFDLMMALIEARGAVVTKSELISRVWPGRVMEEDNLHAQIRALRKAFGDRNLIRTVAGRGYQFAGEVREYPPRGDQPPDSGTVPDVPVLSPAETDSPTPMASEAPLALRTQTPGPRPSLAVLPFTNMSGDEEQEYISDGITEDITTDLSRVSGLFVVARNTAFTYKGRAVEIVQAAQRLDVKFILQGSVRKAAGRIRINVQLIDGSAGGHLWSERYDRDFGDIFTLQDDISRSVVAALKVKLLPDELKAAAGRSTTSAEAYERYLRGRSSLFGGIGDKQSLRAAREMFLEAIDIDPGYARAYAGVAECDAALWISGGIDVSYQDILANSNRALTFAPNLAEAHASRGLALFLSGHADEATAAFERAIELDPELFEAHEWYGEVCKNTGQFAKGAALFERAGELRPADYISLVLLRDCYASLNLHEQSVAAARQAITRIDAQLARRPDDAMAICAGAATLVSLGENPRAEAWAKRAVAIRPEDYLVHYNAACTYAVTGRLDAALEHLEHVFSRTPRVRSWLLGIVKYDVQLDSLRDRPDFREFLHRLEADVSGQSEDPREGTGR